MEDDEAAALPLVLTVEQAGQLLQMPPDTVRKLLSAGRLPGRKVGREWRLTRQALIDYVSGEDNLEHNRSRADARTAQA